MMRIGNKKPLGVCKSSLLFATQYRMKGNEYKEEQSLTLYHFFYWWPSRPISYTRVMFPGINQPFREDHVTSYIFFYQSSRLVSVLDLHVSFIFPGREKKSCFLFYFLRVQLSLRLKVKIKSWKTEKYTTCVVQSSGKTRTTPYIV